MNYESMTDRELDALVAEKALGLSRREGWTGWWTKQQALSKLEAWKPSQNVADAFAVVEAMRERGYFFSCLVARDYTGASFVEETDEHNPKVAEEFADTLPRAIVIAALRALDA